MAARKANTPRSNVPTKKTDEPSAITPVEYGGLQTAFDYLNRVLFDGTLPNVFITYQRRAHSGGYFSPARFSNRAGAGAHHEIALNPDGFVGRTDEHIVSILLHEMAHEWQHNFGKQRRANYSYHDREWAAKMETLGLMPSTTGMVGGKRTGQRMQHYIIPGGAYATAFAALAATGWKLNLQSTIHAGGIKAPPSKVKFSCPFCGSNVWGKPDTEDACPRCEIQAVEAELGEGAAAAIAIVRRCYRRSADTADSVSVAAVASYDEEPVA
jgi:hypothetical protein